MELARQSLDVFIGFVLEYEVSRPDHAHRVRRALMSMAEDVPVEGADFDLTSDSMMSQLDQFESQRTGRV